MSITPTAAELKLIERRRARLGKAKIAKRARPKSPKADRGRTRDPGYLAFLRRQPCCVAGQGLCEGRIDPAHIRFGNAVTGKLNPGMGVKPDDRFAVPLCRRHHTMQHAMNERRWWESYGIDPLAQAAALYAEYLRPDQSACLHAIAAQTGE